MRKAGLLILLLSITCWAAGPPAGQASWLTQGGNQERDAWQMNEHTLNLGNVGQMQLLWKTKLVSAPREMHNLFPPLIVPGVVTPDGTKQIAVVAGVSDGIYALDVATGKLLWQRTFTFHGTQPTGNTGTLCPGGQTAAPTAGPGKASGSDVIYAVSWDGYLHQLNVADGKDVAPPAAFMPGNGKPYALNLVDDVVYTSTAQGCGGVTNAFYSYDLKTHISSAFVPAGGGMWGRNGVGIGPRGTVYMGTGDGPFYPAQKELGNAIVAVKLDPATSQLKLTGYFAPPDAINLWHRDQDINVTPVIFSDQGRNLLVESNKTCRLWLLDRDNFGGADHRTALYTSPQICNTQVTFDGRGVWGAMSAWKDAQGQQWVAVPFWGPVSTTFHAPTEYGRPTQGAVAAFKVVRQDGSWKLTPAWLSQDMDMGEEAIYANGVIYAYGSGEDTHQQRPDLPYNEKAAPVKSYPGASGQSDPRIADSTHATLYALNAATGKTLWSSGQQITDWNHFSGIAVANGRVYIPTYDGTLYCFGLAGQ